MTPGISSAPETSTETMRACAIGLRSTAMWSRPGRVMLSVQLVWPVTSLASSLRRRPRPSSPPAYGLRERVGVLGDLAGDQACVELLGHADAPAVSAGASWNEPGSGPSPRSSEAADRTALTMFW